MKTDYNNPIILSFPQQTKQAFIRCEITKLCTIYPNNIVRGWSVSHSFYYRAKGQATWESIITKEDAGKITCSPHVAIINLPNTAKAFYVKIVRNTPNNDSKHIANYHIKTKEYKLVNETENRSTHELFYL